MGRRELMTERKDYYQILGIEKTSDKKAIKRAYKNAALKYHPDVSKDPNAEEKFKELTEAYAVLSDDTKRREYDSQGFKIIKRYNREELIKTVDLDKIFKGIDIVLSMEKKHGIISGAVGAAVAGRRAKRKSNTSFLTELASDTISTLLGGSSSTKGHRHRHRRRRGR